MMRNLSAVKAGSAFSGQKQRGFVLIVAMVVLGAMALAAVALVRTVDTSTYLARNISFKRDALNRTEILMQVAGSKFLDGGTFRDKTVAQASNVNENFSATMLPSDGRGVPSDILSENFEKGTLSGYRLPITGLPASVAAGGNQSELNKGSYVIERMCTNVGIARKKPNNTNTVVNHCLMSVETSRLARGEPPLPAMYRITAKVSGARNTTAISQQMIVPVVPRLE